ARAPALCRTSDRHAWPAWGRGQPLHALQPDPNRANGNCSRVDDLGMAAARALAMGARKVNGAGAAQARRIRVQKSSNERRSAIELSVARILRATSSLIVWAAQSLNFASTCACVIGSFCDPVA